MREVADRKRIEEFLSVFARAATEDATVYLVGGTSAVLVGWRDSTVDIDLVVRPESDEMLRALPELKERLRVNVELAAPDMFIPVPTGWESRSPLIARIGRVSVRHYDFVAQALAKLERGHTRDLADVSAMIDRGLVTPHAVRVAFEQIAPLLYRYPAVDPAAFRRAVDTACPPG